MADSGTCKIVASVVAEGLDFMGSSGTPEIYICTAAGVYAPPAAPLACASAAAAYAVGRFAQTPMGKMLIEEATEKGCEVVVRITGSATEVLLVKGAEAETKLESFMHEAKRTYSSLNTIEGANWLRHVLSKR